VNGHAIETNERVALLGALKMEAQDRIAAWFDFFACVGRVDAKRKGAYTALIEKIALQSFEVAVP